MGEVSEHNGALTEATLWFRKNEKGVFEYNHIEDGHSLADKPLPKTANQSGWARGTWIREHVRLDGSTPPKVMRDRKAGVTETLATPVLDE
jgi:hypothetical protein